MYIPVQRFQKTVLSLGIKKNSLSMYQVYVAQALIKVPKDVILVHYMDDLLAHPDKKYSQNAVVLLLQGLSSLKLMVAPKKIQRVSSP